MACNPLITQNLVGDCSVNPVLGLKSGVIINYDDIDWSATTKTGSIVTDLILLTGKTGYEVSWVKRLGSNNNSFVASTDSREGFTHSFACQLAGFSADNADRISELKGGKFLLVAESNFRGENNEDTYKVFGYTAGLYLTEAIASSNENGGAITYILSTLEGDLEENIYDTYLKTDYETAKERYDSLFEQV